MTTQRMARMLAAMAVTLLCTTAHSASLLVNGSFESTSAGGTVFNPGNGTFNALMAGVTAYGARQGIDIQTFGSGYGLSP